MAGGENGNLSGVLIQIDAVASRPPSQHRIHRGRFGGVHRHSAGNIEADGDRLPEAAEHKSVGRCRGDHHKPEAAPGTGHELAGRSVGIVVQERLDDTTNPSLNPMGAIAP